jgi:stage II sporulation protein R
MRKSFICFLLFLCLCAVAIFVGISQNSADSSPQTYSASDYLRIHVRANSNAEEDQNVKYAVKDEVVNFLTPYVAECYTKEEALQKISGILPQIERVCNDKLSSCGYSYSARAKICTEQFPTRVYGDLTLNAGVYDALIIELGEGVGDNWWCVIYPPLCFTSASSSVQYRSLILDIIDKFTKSHTA